VIAKMPASIDHLVTLTADMAQTSAAMARIGFSLTPPSLHETGAWTNRNILLDNGYWELQQVHQLNQLTRPLSQSFARRRGLHGICLTSTDINASVAEARRAEISISEPFSFSRTVRVNGRARALRFSIAHCLDAPDGLLLFFCQRIGSAHIFNATPANHLNGAVAIDSIVLVSRAPDQCATYLARLFASKLEATGGGFKFSAPGVAVEITRPTEAGSQGAVADRRSVEATVRLKPRGQAHGPRPELHDEDLPAGLSIQFIE